MAERNGDILEPRQGPREPLVDDGPVLQLVQARQDLGANVFINTIPGIPHAPDIGGGLRVSEGGGAGVACHFFSRPLALFAPLARVGAVCIQAGMRLASLSRATRCSKAASSASVASRRLLAAMSASSAPRNLLESRGGGLALCHLR